MTVCATHLTFRDFAINRFPYYPIYYQLGNAARFFLEVIKVEDNRICFAAIYTRMEKKIFANAITIPTNGL